MKGVTTYQLEILNHLTCIERDTGRLTDMDQLLDRLTWKPSKESAQFTIRAMVTKKFIEKAPLEPRRGRNRVCYRITFAGKSILDPRILATKPERESLDLFVPGGSELEVLDVPGVPELEIHGEEILEN